MQVQQMDEQRHLNKEDRQQILKEANLKVTIEAEEGVCDYTLNVTTQ